MSASDATLVRHAASSVWRRGTHHSLERCDLEQIGWLALLEAQAAAAALPDPAPGPDRAADARLQLQRIMANGSARVCEAVTLMAEHMHARTVAAQMGIGESAAGKLLHRAAALADPQPRPAKPRADPTHPHSVRMADAHWAAYQALGGHAWLAGQIEAAAPQVVDSQGKTAIANPSSPVRLRIAPPENS